MCVFHDKLETTRTVATTLDKVLLTCLPINAYLHHAAYLIDDVVSWTTFAQETY